MLSNMIGDGTLLTIGQLARSCGVSVETIRFYEKQGLIDNPARTPAGYRQYPPDHRRRLHFILRAKEVGFSLKDIKELLALRSQSGDCCQDIRQLAREKISEIDGRITDLQRMKLALETLERQCGDDDSDCPIIDALENESILTDH